MLRTLTLLTLLSFAFVSAHTKASPPVGWREIDDADGNNRIELSFFLKTTTERANALELELIERSTPSSSKYGQGWMTNEEVHEMVNPCDGAVSSVLAFLHAHGATGESRTPNSDIITADISITVAEKMLNADYRIFEHETTETTLVRTVAYHIPAVIANAVAFVGPTDRFSQRHHVPITVPSSLGAEGNLTSSTNDPATLRALYNVGDALGGQASSNKQAVTAFLGQTYSADAEAAFFTKYLPEAADTPIGTVGDAITGGVTPGIEAMLDIEYMPAMGALNPTEFWGFSGSSPNDSQDEPFLTWLYTVGNTSDADVPLVFSTSYGEDETTEVPTAYSDRINIEFMKAGARGISLLFASGDSGAAAVSGTSCPNGRFAPKWPSASPYITAVGGTNGVALPETSWTGSSGGFSDVFPVPSWQADAVAGYLARDDLPDASLFNSTGRGFPDISAAAVSFPVVLTKRGVSTSVAGTSCAAPTAGGIFGLLNDARLVAGKTSLGFLNPLLYANADALLDVTSGSQKGCTLLGGFPATAGWDAVTGLGSPDYEALLAVILALP